MDRRSFLKLSVLGTSAFALCKVLKLHDSIAEETRKFPLTLSEQEWKKMLTPDQFNVLREEGTERAFTSPLNAEKREGIFACVGCGQELFESIAKFESGTGWPSFYQAIEGRIETKTDYKIGVPRTEYHCSKCGGHHGHVFNDGPKPTGLRYCNNGVVLKFTPKEG